MPKISPDILKWARETAGFSLEEAVDKLGIKETKGVSSIERLSALEAGKGQPTRSLLIKMAKHYRRPLVVFYMEKPPQKGNRGQDFRTLPDKFTDENHALVDALLRNVFARQSLIRSAIEDDENFTPIEFIGSMSLNDGVDKVVNQIIKITNFNLYEFRSQQSLGNAFRYLRAKIENTGVFVLLIGDLGSYHSAIDLELFRGFSISDNIAPFIVINDRDSKAAWSFTLLHEFVHILLGQTGISGIDSESAIEVFCNNVAGELLLPQKEISDFTIKTDTDIENIKIQISRFANKRNISSSMVAYKLFLDNKIDKQLWRELNKKFLDLWLSLKEEKREQNKGKSSGPSYYVVQRYRLGENIISYVHEFINSGNLSSIKAGKILGVSPKKLQYLFDPTLSINKE